MSDEEFQKYLIDNNLIDKDKYIILNKSIKYNQNKYNNYLVTMYNCIKSFNIYSRYHVFDQNIT